MMDCRRSGDVPLYFDGELDPAATREFERHLDGCDDCRAALFALDSLRRDVRDSLPPTTAPAALRERLETIAASSRPTGRSWIPLAAAAAFAFVVGGVATTAWHARETTREALARDLFASHWRALAAASPVDVVSTDRHTVKPWFAGKVAQAPLVRDFAADGYPLVGGRIDYVGEARVPVLVYRHGQHLVDVFVLGEAGAGAITAASRRGYTLDPLMLDGQVAAVVSDLDAAELARFTARLAATDP
jgi:anti-sigma factor RsiW